MCVYVVSAGSVEVGFDGTICTRVKWRRGHMGKESFYAAQVKSMEIMVEFVLEHIASTIITLKYGKKGISFFRSWSLKNSLRGLYKAYAPKKHTFLCFDNFLSM